MSVSHVLTGNWIFKTFCVSDKDMHLSSWAALRALVVCALSQKRPPSVRKRCTTSYCQDPPVYFLAWMLVLSSRVARYLPARVVVSTTFLCFIHIPIRLIVFPRRWLSSTVHHTWRHLQVRLPPVLFDVKTIVVVSRQLDYANHQARCKGSPSSCHWINCTCWMSRLRHIDLHRFLFGRPTHWYLSVAVPMNSGRVGLNVQWLSSVFCPTLRTLLPNCEPHQNCMSPSESHWRRRCLPREKLKQAAGSKLSWEPRR